MRKLIRLGNLLTKKEKKYKQLINFETVTMI